MKRLLFIFLLAFNQGFAQDLTNNLSVGIQFGTIEYRGDLGSEFFTFDGVHPSIGLHISKYVTPSFDLMGKIKHGVIDHNTFSNSLVDLNLTLKYKFNNNYILNEKSLIAPYIFTGIGDAVSIYTDKTLGLKEQPLAEFNLPIGVGIQFNINPKFSCLIETHYNYVINDRVDGVLAGKWDDSFLYNTIGFNYHLSTSPDTDGDGVADEYDKCPKVPGSKLSNGCPDSDNDGVIDIEDKCPKYPGTKEDGGCPPNYFQHVEIMAKARKGLLFNTGSAIIKQESFAVLDNVVKVMIDNPNYKLDIEGHTDNTGSAQENMNLSSQRAEAAKNYITSKGIKQDRIRAIGYGEKKPIANNTTEEGRSKNRRVDFNIRF